MTVNEAKQLLDMYNKIVDLIMQATEVLKKGIENETTH